MEFLKKVIHNKIFLYLFSRYCILALGFISSLLVAAKLGPYYFGIYGFILLILSYFNQIHLGIPNSLNVLLIHNKEDIGKSNNYIANSLFLYVYFVIAIALLYLLYLLFGFSPVEKYQADSYIPAVCIIAILEYVNGVLLCVLRIQNKINLMSVVTSIKAILNLIFVVLFSNEQLILALVFCLIISDLLIVIICGKNNVFPSYKSITIKKKIQREILRKGIMLFFYNTCFYFIVISIRSVVSSNYSVEDFGSFTFSFTIVTAVMMLLDSIYTIMFPKVVDLLSSNQYEKINHTLDIVRVSYVSTSHLLVYVSLCIFPIVTNYILPNYGNSLISLNLVSLAMLMNANSTGYSTLLIAQNKEKYSAIISISSLILNIALALIGVHVLHVPYYYVIIATMITYLYFSLVIVIVGKKIINQFSWKDSLLTFFPIRLLLPFLTALFLSIINTHYLMFLPLLLYIIFNVNDIRRIKNYIFVIINNENISDINQ